ncbi:MAG: hypothetical protein WD576_03545 [Nitriliruptoraceae bacterium]
MTVVVALAIAGRLPINSRDDLVGPLAIVAAVSSIGLLGHQWISDWIGWGLPLATLSLAALTLAATTRADLTGVAPFSMAYAALVIVTTVVLYQPMTMALHPLPEVLPSAGDATITIVDPRDDAEVEPSFDLTVVVTDGGIGFPAADFTGGDPEAAGALRVTVDGDQYPITWDGCSQAAPCERVTVPLSLDPGERRITVEFTRSDGMPFAPFIADRVTVVVVP